MKKSTLIGCLVAAMLPMSAGAAPANALVAAAKSQIGVTVKYDGKYE